MSDETKWPDLTIDQQAWNYAMTAFKLSHGHPPQTGAEFEEVSYSAQKTKEELKIKSNAQIPAAIS